LKLEKAGRTYTLRTSWELRRDVAGATFLVYRSQARTGYAGRRAMNGNRPIMHLVLARQGQVKNERE
jgi:hypothetical protein